MADETHLSSNPTPLVKVIDSPADRSSARNFILNITGHNREFADALAHMLEEGGYVSYPQISDSADYGGDSGISLYLSTLRGGEIKPLVIARIREWVSQRSPETTFEWQENREIDMDPPDPNRPRYRARGLANIPNGIEIPAYQPAHRRTNPRLTMIAEPGTSDLLITTYDTILRAVQDMSLALAANLGRTVTISAPEVSADGNSVFRVTTTGPEARPKIAGQIYKLLASGNETYVGEPYDRPSRICGSCGAGPCIGKCGQVIDLPRTVNTAFSDAELVERRFRRLEQVQQGRRH